MDKKQEEWMLGTAVAAVRRERRAIMLRLRGHVTAMVFEALHVELGREEPALQRAVVFDDDALMLATKISAADATVRGTPLTRAGRCHVAIGVRAPRLRWAREYCAVTSLSGLSRSVFLLRPELPQGQLVLPLV